MKSKIYHATTHYHYNKIMNDDILFGSLQEKGNLKGQKGIFVTRDFQYAKGFHGKDTRVIILDKEKIKNNFRIKPIKNWEMISELPIYLTNKLGSNEFEEFIFTDKIEFISDFILDYS